MYNGLKEYIHFLGVHRVEHERVALRKLRVQSDIPGPILRNGKDIAGFARRSERFEGE